MPNIGLLILRVVPAMILLASHGWGKLLRIPNQMHDFPDPLGVGSATSLILVVFAEVVCSIFLILGIATRWAAIPPALVMAVAVGIVHANDPWGNKELGFLFLTVFVTLFFTGGGRFGLGDRFHSDWLKS